MIGLFLRDLVRQLTEQDRRWRSNTLFFWDNAPYHQSKETRRLLAELQLHIGFSGPMSYDASPCELWFARFKTKDINPRKVKTGKR